jgi:glycerate dehydrogenase
LSESIVILDGYTLNPGDLSWDRLHELGEVAIHDRTPAESILKHADGAAYLLTNKTPLDAQTLCQLPALKYIGVLATGYNVVDVLAARNRNIPVTNVPTYGTDTVAQHTVSLMLELARHTCAHTRAVAQGQWNPASEWCLPVAPIIELSGKTLGIIGLGRIGLAVAKIAQAMGMTIIAHTSRPSPPQLPHGLSVTCKPLDEVFTKSDVLSLHCPLTPKTEHLVNAQRLRSMKPTAFIINTGRGPLIDDNALAEALRGSEIAGAALDVLDAEPPPPGNPLLNAPNCIITPHIAWYAREARNRLLNTAIDNLRGFIEGKPRNVVNA